ncbi:AMOP domain-containing protein [Mucilaginibacter gracilis]|uniref:AMOP domain-containing protein n=1 Tax=Mucilaginibacter gracilis TaxID=423350 RepID=A0A495J8D8_9SPHI|nr:hypothetical protein [Mucilaginibacter gracilis]RKR85147.1 AMOP domain-containing protein [Mucilaginibacter gracilis]
MKLIFLVLLLLSMMNATVVAQQKDTTRWYQKLPACPCRNPDFNGVKLNDGWAKDKGNLAKYHKGATASFRSYPAVKTEEGKSCQQCCYDSKGDLIVSGRAAGTLDKKSACSGEDKNGLMTVRYFGLIGHYFKDVKPWNNLMKKDTAGWKAYNALWIPNNGNHCGL